MILFRNVKVGIKIFFIFFLVFIFMHLALEISKEKILENFNSNWDKYIAQKEKEAVKVIEKEILKFSEEFKSRFDFVKEKTRKSIKEKGDLPSVLENFKTPKNSGEVFALFYQTGELGVYNENYSDFNCSISFENCIDKNFFILENDNFIFLSKLDTIKISQDLFYFFYSRPVKRKFTLSDTHSNYFHDEIKEKYQIEIVLSEKPFYFKRNYFAANSKLGKFYIKISLKDKDDFISEKQKEIKKLSLWFLFLSSTFLLIFILLTINQYARKPFFALIAKIFAFASYRIGIFLLGFPKAIMDNDLTNEALFDSDFALGIAKSPIELFATILIFFAIALSIAGYFNNHFLTKKLNLKYYEKLVASIIFVSLFFIFYRSYLASCKSAVFESSYAYFSESGLTLPLAGGLMYINFYLINIFAILVEVVILMVLLKIWTEEKSDFKFILALFLTINLLGIIFDLIQKDKLVSSEFRIFFILSVFLISYFALVKKKKKILIGLSILILGAIVSSLSLNYFNNSMNYKLISKELRKFARENIEKIVVDLNSDLKKLKTSYNIIKSFQNSNYNKYFLSAEFWKYSKLKEKKYPLLIRLYDREGKLSSEFSVGFTKLEKNLLGAFLGSNASFEKNIMGAKFLIGSTIISNQNEIVGYANIICKAAPEIFREENYPAFLKKELKYNMQIYKSINFYEFNNNELVLVYGNYYPDYKSVNAILADNFNKNNEKKFEVETKNAAFLGYAFLERTDREYIVRAALLKERKDIGIIYNYVKAFVYNTIIALIIFSILLLFEYSKNKKFEQMDFRTKALTAIIVVSIVPILIQAYFFWRFSLDQSREYVESQLKKKADILENYLIANYFKYSSDMLRELCVEADRNLDFNFTIYKNNKVYYSSYDNYYKAGIFSEYFHPEARAAVSYFDAKDSFVEENIDNYDYKAYYKSASIGNEKIIIKIDECFNKIEISTLYSEAQIILLASLGLSVFLMLGFGVQVANQITRPIRELERASLLVAEGDYNVKINVSESQKDFWNLAKAFEIMTQNIKRSQKLIAELEREAAWKSIARQVAHEIKNPLTPLKLSIQQLVALKKENPEKFEQNFDKIISSALSQIETINRISTEFSYFARLPNPKIEMIEISPLLKELSTLFASEKLDVVLLNVYSGETILGDKEQLKIVFVNLFRNSIEAGATKVLITMSREEKFYNIFVQNNGKGIPKEYEDKIFNEGFTLKPKGMGIGLATCKKIIENFGGEISLDKNTSDGVGFKIKLPKAR